MKKIKQALDGFQALGYKTVSVSEIAHKTGIERNTIIKTIKTMHLRLRISHNEIYVEFEIRAANRSKLQRAFMLCPPVRKEVLNNVK